ncbi:hypothetical protein [uncultured Sunxiuqinia sp.]|uniref:hypothetical protein n=1 Tax=Sunxiuqinia rutila TaxID=1397841 RepID=UPI0026238409|nr:hypothetical protein [uncultured Sunxiuqinia sp.]
MKQQLSGKSISMKIIVREKQCNIFPKQENGLNIHLAKSPRFISELNIKTLNSSSVFFGNTCFLMKNQKQARVSVFECIETWYNTQSLHSALNYLSPVEFAESINKQKLAA